MVDTARSQNDLLTNLFADSQPAGSITPQDMRDLIVSLSPPYGAYYFTATAATTIAVAGTFVKALGTTVLTNAREFTMPSNNRLTYTGVPDRHMHLVLSASFISAGTNDNLSIALARNGAVITHTEMTRFVSTGSDQGSTASHGDVVLSTNDYIELFVTNEDAAVDVTVQQAYVFAMGMIV